MPVRSFLVKGRTSFLVEPPTSCGLLRVSQTQPTSTEEECGIKPPVFSFSEAENACTTRYRPAKSPNWRINDTDIRVVLGVSWSGKVVLDQFLGVKPRRMQWMKVVSEVSCSVWRHGSRGSGDTAAKILRRPIPTHPLAVPPSPGSFGVWQVRRVRSAPIGYVRSHPELGGFAYHCYAYGRDGAGRRPWLHRADSLNSAVAWMIQHERELSAMTTQLQPEPDEWPS